MVKKFLVNSIFTVFAASYFILLVTNAEYIDFSRYRFTMELFTLVPIILTFLILFVYFVLEKKSISLLTPDKLFILLYIMMIYPGVLFLSAGKEQDMIIFSQSLSIFFFIFAVIMVKSLLKSIYVIKKDTIISRHCKALAENNVLIKLVMFITVLLVVFYVASGNFNRSDALRGLISLVFAGYVDESVAVNLYRSQIYYTDAGGLSVMIANYTSVIVLPIISMFFILEGRKQNKIILKIFGVLVLFTALIFSIGTGSRLTTMKIVLYVLIVLSMVYKVKIKIVLQIGFMGFMLLVLTTVLLGRGNSGEGLGLGAVIAKNSERAFSRFMLGKGGSTLFVYEYYPQIEDYEYGSTMARTLIGNIGDKKTESLAIKMHKYKYGVLGTAGPQTFGDFYANIGYLGQISAAFIIGLFFPLIYLVALKKKYWGSFDVAFIGYIFLTFGYMGYSDAMSFKTSGLHIVLLCYSLYLIIKSLLKINNRTRSSQVYAA